MNATRAKQLTGLVMLIGLWIALIAPSTLKSSRFLLTDAVNKSRTAQKPGQSSSQAAAPESTQQTKERASEAYGRLPISFEVNRGQTDSSVKFLARGRGYNLFLTPTEAVLSLRKESRRAKGEKHIAAEGRGHDPALSSHASASKSTLRMKLVGANASTEVTGQEQLPGRINYFRGRDKSAWQTDVANYAKVKYQDVYPGVDMIYYGNQRELEYDFRLAPGVDPKVIKLAFAGARAISIEESGELSLKTASGELRQHQPVAYQEADGVRQAVAARYALKGGQVSFEVGDYDASKPLVIDPVLAYSTYLGGSGNDYGSDIAVDADGNAYVTGITEGINFPTTNGAAQTTFGGGNNDIFITKLNSTGSALVYSTYIGGDSDEYVRGIALDSNGSVYVAGGTRSANFPATAGVYQSNHAGQNDVFVTKLDGAGALVYSTFIGSNVDDIASGIALNSDGEIYITGETYGTHYPTTPGAFQLTYPGNQSDWFSSKIFVTKLNATASALVYSTYLTGSGRDYGRDIAIDSASNAYITGETDSTDFPITPGAFQTTRNGSVSCYVSKLNATGSELLYSTYLGGSGNAFGRGIALDATNHAYVTGVTSASSSAGFPTTPGAYQNNPGSLFPSNSHTFVTKLSTTGDALDYSLLLTADIYVNANDIAVDSSGNAYIAGYEFSNTFPRTADQIPTPSGDYHAFVSKFDSTGATLLSSTRFGVGTDGAIGLALDSAGNAYITGYTHSTDFPTTPGAFQNTSGGGFNDAFIAKLDYTPIAPRPSELGITMSATPEPVATGTNVTYNVTVSNGGPYQATGVNVTAEFPAGTVPQSISPPFICEQDNQGDVTIFSCTPGDVDAFASTSLTFVVNVNAPAGSTIQSTAHVSSTSPDPDLSNNSTTTTSTVVLTPTPTPTPPINGKIAFVSVRDGDPEIYVMDSDGSNQTNITNNSPAAWSSDSDPAWSPDGSKIVFASNRDAFSGLYIMNADGTGVVNIPNVGSSNPAWSPDGTKIAYMSNQDIYTVNVDGTNPTRLTNSVNNTKPSWSPDGQFIAFESWRVDQSEIYVMAQDGSNPTRLTTTLGMGAYDPAWSPDGSKLAFHSYRDGNFEIFTMDTQGGNQTRITNNSAEDFSASWSPDSNNIVFTSNRDGNQEIYVMDADGYNQTRLTNVSANDYNPSWQHTPTAPPPPPTADLYTYGFAEQNYVPSGGQINLTIFVGNAGPDEAANVTLTGELPAGVTFNSANSSGGSCAGVPGSASFNCTFPTADISQAKLISVSATATGAPYTQFTPTFTVASDTFDSNSNNNIGSAQFYIASPPLPTPSPGPVDEAQLAYEKFDENTFQSDIFRQRADGAGLLNLTNDPAQESGFQWSPDGSKLAFLRYDYANLTVSFCVKDADGSNLRVLTNVPGEYISSYAWSPDGSKFIFSVFPYSNDTPDGQIYVINADGTGRVNVSGTDGFNTDPAWSPDGSKFIFMRGHYFPDGSTPTNDFYIANADGSNPIKIAHADGERDFGGVWSPDGTLIAFSRLFADNTNHIYTVRPDGSDVRPLINDPAVQSSISQWSPDGSKLLFDSYSAGGGSAIEVINADGSGRATLYTPQQALGYSAGGAKWSPDGSKVVFSYIIGEASGGDVCVMNADGTGLHCLGNSLEHNAGPDWSPDSQRLAFTSYRNGVQSIDIINADGTKRVELTSGGGYGPKWRPRPQQNTPAGANVTVAENGATLTFSNVTQAGETTVTPIDPNSLQGVPGEYVINANSLAFEIHTTATYSGPITIGFQVPGINNPITFSTLRVLHGEPPPVPNFVDRTVLAPDSPAPDFATRTVYARVNSLSPFIIAEHKEIIPPVTTATLSQQPNAAGWHKANVNVTLTATDNENGSGVQSITYSASGAQAIAETTMSGSTATIPITTEGTTTISYRARDFNSNVEAVKTITVKLDKTAPIINVTQPTASVYTIGQVVTANFNCTDAASSVATCTGTVANSARVDTASVGAKTFTVNATDVAGNSASKTVNYTVAYGVNPLFDQTKANKSGSTIPIKLELVDAAGVNRSAANILVSALSVVRVSDNAPGTLQAPGNSNPDLDFNYQSSGYHFNLKTTGYATGTYRLSFRAGNDPVIHTVQFQVK